MSDHSEERLRAWLLKRGRFIDGPTCHYLHRSGAEFSVQMDSAHDSLFWLAERVAEIEARELAKSAGGVR